MSKENLGKVELVLTDCDGVLTDGGIYYNEHSNTQRKFNVRDGKGFELLHRDGTFTGILSSEEGESRLAIERRATKLKVDFCRTQVDDKVKAVRNIQKDFYFNIPFYNIAYIGDDINDISLMKKVGYAFYPEDADSSVSLIEGARELPVKGGNGVFRHLANLIITLRKGVEHWKNH